MDYILFGAGTGASLAVIGWILREWGPRLRDGKPDDGIIHSASELIDRMSWARFCASCGMTMVVAGTLILLATAVVAAWNPGDDLAAWILIGAYLFVSLLMLIWAFLYTRQFGTGGIYRPITIDPPIETLEAVPVVQSDPSSQQEESIAEGTSDGSPMTDTSPANPPDFAEVAARRGGLSRFASFFNRQRTGDADSGDEPIIEEAVVEVESSAADERSAIELQTSEVIVESDEEAEAESEPVTVEESEEIPVATASEVDPAPVTGDTESSGESAPAATASPAANTPEDEALAELRRRRLARLSGRTE